jgi:hypothetical protein
MCEAIEHCRRRVLGGRQHGKQGGVAAAGVCRALAEDAVTVRPQNLESFASVSAGPRRLVQWLYSAASWFLVTDLADRPALLNLPKPTRTPKLRAGVNLAWDRLPRHRYCGSKAVTERREVTARGYRRFRCRDCRRQFNKRSNGVLNRSARATFGFRPKRGMTDGHGSHQCVRGFNRHDAAELFCREHRGVRNRLWPRRRHNQIVSASLRRARFFKATCIALNLMQNG